MEGIARIGRYYLLSPRSLWDQWSRQISRAVYKVCWYGIRGMVGCKCLQVSDPILPVTLSHTRSRPIFYLSLLSPFDIHMNTWVGLGWGGLLAVDQSPSLKIFSLAPNHQFTHCGFTCGGVIPGEISLHSHVCTGKFTQTRVTLTVFYSKSVWCGIFFNPQEPGETA